LQIIFFTKNSTGNNKFIPFLSKPLVLTSVAASI